MNRLIKTTCSIAAEDIGPERARRIAAMAQKRYEALCAENASDSKALRAHTFKRIYPGIAVYEALVAPELEKASGTRNADYVTGIENVIRNAL